MDIDKEYRQQLHRGADIFAKSFEGIRGARFPKQKKAFEKAANEALQGIHDAAGALLKKELKKLDSQLHTDYSAYLSDPTDANASKVLSDIDDLKKQS